VKRGSMSEALSVCDHWAFNVAEWFPATLCNPLSVWTVLNVTKDLFVELPAHLSHEGGAFN